MSTSNMNSEHNRHHAFLKHIPIPYSLAPYFNAKNDDDIDEQKGERNQRAISLFGMGSTRREVKKKRKKLVSDLYNLFSDQSDETSNLNSSEHVKMFRKMTYYDKWGIGFFLAKRFLTPCSKLEKVFKDSKRDAELKKIQSYADMKLPTKNGMSCLVDLILESGNILNVLEFIQFSISYLLALERGWKKMKVEEKNAEAEKTISATYNNHMLYIRHIGLIFTGVLKQTHKYLVLEPELCYKTFSSLHRLLHQVDPSECFASERCMLIHINKIANSSKYIQDKMNGSQNGDQWKSKSAKIKGTR